MAPCVLNAAARQEKNERSEAGQQIEDATATIKGSLDLTSNTVGDFDWETLQGSLGQLVTLQQRKLPDDWQEMVVEKRQGWLAAFFETDEGKALRTANQKVLDQRHVQEFRIRDEGKFVIYDVPRGRFELQIVGQKKVGDKTWVLQSYGQFQVGEVDELDFSNMPVDILRLLSKGEVAPEIKGNSSKGGQISLSDLRGKYVLLAFGNTANPAFEITTRMLNEASVSTESSDRLEVLTVTVDEDEDAVAKFNEKNKVDWHCLNLGNWDLETLNRYGLKSVPSFWLIDAEGKIVLTDRQFGIELNRTGFTVAKLVDEAIAGRLTLTEDVQGEDSETDQDGSDKQP